MTEGGSYGLRARLSQGAGDDRIARYRRRASPRYQLCGQTQPPRQRFSSTFELTGILRWAGFKRE